MPTTKRKHAHMSYIRPFLILNGIWPLDLKGFLGYLYNLYFYILYTFFILNVGTVYITLKEVASHGKLTDLTNHISNTVFATLLIFKAWTYRSNGVKELLNLILKTEENIFENYDGASKEIYNKNVAAAQFLGSVYIYQGLFTSGCAQIFPLIMTLSGKADESGHIERYYIVPNWEPFDKYEYYYTAYTIQLIYTLLAETYIVFCGTFFLFILKNITGQLLVLQQRLAEINENALKITKQNRTTFREACHLLLKNCIKQHQEVIRLVDHVDKTFQNYIFVDYIFTSFGLSVVVLRFLLEDTIQMKIATAGFFFAFASQSLIIYYYADEVARESSSGLCQAIFASSWFQIDVSAQKLLIFVILRIHKPLTLSIGPFRKVGVNSMIALFKATYSYLSVMWQ